MAKYIVYNLKALENLKLARTNMQIDSHDSLNYISGSAIRGAFIYKYIRENDVKDINRGIHREKLLTGGIKFLNAYPLFKGMRSEPLPKAYFAPKADIKAFENKIDICLGLGEELPPGYEKIRLSEFVYKEGDRLTKVKVEKISNLHINKVEEKNRIFRYEAIKKHQEFAGIIKVEKDEYAKEVVNLLSNQIIYIGGSKGSGYGKSIIENMKILDYNPENQGYIFDENSKYLYLIALSDIIYKSDNGLFKTEIDEHIVKEQLGLERVEYVDSSIDTTNITNFNNKWNARTPNIVAIRAGSVFKYKIFGILDKEKIEKFMDMGLGERKSEGFGRFYLTSKMDNMEYHSYMEEKEKQKAKLNLKDEEKEILNLIGKRIYNKRLENRINSRVLELDKNLENTKVLKQWGIWKDFFMYLSTMDIEEGRKIYDDYMGHIYGKRSVSYKDMQKVKYKTTDQNIQSLKEFFDDSMKNILNKEIFTDTFKGCEVEISKDLVNIDESLIYRTNLKVLSELCRYQIRKEDI